jgi:hypothetical protein
MRSSSQITVLVLAVALSLYFWLGYYAFIFYALVAVALALYLYLSHFRAKKTTQTQSTSAVAPTQELQQRDEQIVCRRKLQGQRLLTVAEQIKSSRSEYSRLMERLLDWYLEYLRDNMLYHQDLYHYLLLQIKERSKTAKANSKLKTPKNGQPKLPISILLYFTAETRLLPRISGSQKLRLQKTVRFLSTALQLNSKA